MVTTGVLRMSNRTASGLTTISQPIAVHKNVNGFIQAIAVMHDGGWVLLRKCRCAMLSTRGVSLMESVELEITPSRKL